MKSESMRSISDSFDDDDLVRNLHLETITMKKKDDGDCKRKKSRRKVSNRIIETTASVEQPSEIDWLAPRTNPNNIDNSMICEENYERNQQQWKAKPSNRNHSLTSLSNDDNVDDDGKRQSMRLEFWNKHFTQNSFANNNSHNQIISIILIILINYNNNSNNNKDSNKRIY
ncbi:hypothetical protein QR98_0104270 [Sarcoptes scabiei]|uniref:Uncharacterized protein n=1 Tax=Sarcoptes scabiei TaxID=52283 RepID=A0A132ALL3_SARSC|nr:hypothetical protein QR98_0104270 [Sarcoptes scabiei]